MRKLILQMQISIDGFVGSPDGKLDWIFKNMDAELTDWIVEHLWQAGIHIMGRRTFQDMRDYWPNSNEPFAAPMNEILKAVFTKKEASAINTAEHTQAFHDAARAQKSDEMNASRVASAASSTWTHTTVLNGELAREIALLKNQPGKDILAHGGAGFARNLVNTGLIDEYRLITHPIALGKGLPLFSELSKPLPLKFVNSTRFSNAIAHTFQPVAIKKAVPVDA